MPSDKLDARLNDSRDRRDEKLITIQAKLDAAKEEVKELKTENVKVQWELDNSSRKVEELEERIATLEAARAAREHTQKIVGPEKTDAAATYFMQVESIHVIQLKKAHRKLKGEHSRLLQEQTERSQTSIRLALEVGKLREEIAELSRQNRALIESRERSKACLLMVEDVRAQIEAQRDRLLERVAALESADLCQTGERVDLVKKHAAEIRLLEESLEEKGTLIVKLTARLHEDERVIETLQQEKNGLLEKITALRSIATIESDERLVQVEKHEADKPRPEESVEEKEKTIADLKKKLNDDEGRIETLLRSVSQREVELANIKSQMSNMTAEIARAASPARMNVNPSSHEDVFITSESANLESAQLVDAFHQRLTLDENTPPGLSTLSSFNMPSRLPVASKSPLGSAASARRYAESEGRAKTPLRMAQLLHQSSSRGSIVKSPASSSYAFASPGSSGSPRAPLSATRRVMNEQQPMGKVPGRDELKASVRGPWKG